MVTEAKRICAICFGAKLSKNFDVDAERRTGRRDESKLKGLQHTG